MFSEAPFTQVASDASRALVELFDGAAQSPEAFADFMHQVHLDRTYLFFMTGSSKASPYESVWRSEDETLFGPQTLEVRAMYKRGGLVFERAANEPDDHIGLEFSFVAHLLHAAAEGDEAALPLLREFLAEHLLAFGPDCLARIAERDHGAYFSGRAPGLSEGAGDAVHLIVCLNQKARGGSAAFQYGSCPAGDSRAGGETFLVCRS